MPLSSGLVLKRAEEILKRSDHGVGKTRLDGIFGLEIGVLRREFKTRSSGMPV